MEFELEAIHGILVLLMTLPVVLNFWQMSKVGKSREKFGVYYPNMTTNGKHPEFECVMRAHQNTLELVPFYLITLLMAGVSSQPAKLYFSHV